MVTSRAGTIRAAAMTATGSLLFALALLGGPVEPAAAAGNGLLVSTNGVDFATGSTLPLFASMGKVVPGDRSTERIWLKNDSGAEAVLRVDLVDPSADDAALASAFSLSLAPQRSVAPVSIADGVRNGECTVLGGGIALAPGASVRLDLTAGVASALTGRRGMRGSVRFRLRGVLIESAAARRVAPGDKCPEQPGHPVRPPAPGPLPVTGPSALLPFGLFGAMAIATGVVFCVLGRRRRPPGEGSAPENGSAPEKDGEPGNEAVAGGYGGG